MNPLRSLRNLRDAIAGEQESWELDFQEAGDLLHNHYHPDRRIPICFSSGVERFETKSKIRLSEAIELIQGVKYVFLEPHHLHYDIEVRFAPDRVCCFKLPN